MKEEPPLDSKIADVAPIDTGAEGNQTARATDEGQLIVTTEDFHQAESNNIGAVLGTHIDARNPTAMTFAVAAFRDGQASREILKNQLHLISEERDRFRDQYYETNTQLAVLSAQVTSATRLHRFQAWAFALGGILAGAGLGRGLEFGDFRFPDVLLFFFGLILMWIGSPFFQSDK